jgi:regulator of cell morphogenesis and NO signaling
MKRRTAAAPPLDSMCDDIVLRDHAALRGSLERIRCELAALPAAAEASGLKAVRQAFAELDDQIRGHLLKEENVLFPALGALAAADREGGARPTLPFPTVLHPIRVMEAEHVRIEAAVDRVRAAARAAAWPGRRSPGWRRCLGRLSRLDRDLREHHRTENEVLFPRALEVERRLL